MQIGFDAKRAFNNYSGLGNYSRYVISNICKFYPENEYRLYTPRTPDDNIYLPPHNASIVKPKTFIGKSFKGYWRSFRLAPLLKKENIKIYHGLSNELPSGIYSKGIRSLITIHDLIFLRLPHLYKPFDRATYKKKVEYGVQVADKIIAVSQQTKDDIVELLKVNPDKIEVVYQGCNQNFYHKVDHDFSELIKTNYALPEEYLLYVGTIEERKNLLKIIEALHIGNIDIPLIVVGKKTPYFNLVMQYIKEHDLKNIRFLEDVSVTDLAGIYQAASGFVYPSAYEGFGIPVLEALNSGCPVVTSRGGCLEETVGNGGLTVDPENTEEMIHALKQIIEDSGLRDQLIRGGREHALKFREINTIPALYNLYLDCL